MPPLLYLLGATASGTVLSMLLKRKVCCIRMKRFKLNTLEEIEKALDFGNRNVWDGKVTLVVKIFTDLDYSCCILELKNKFKTDLVKEAIINFNPYAVMKEDKLKGLKYKPYTMELTGKEIILTYDFRQVKINSKDKGLIIS